MPLGTAISISENSTFSLLSFAFFSLHLEEGCAVIPYLYTSSLQTSLEVWGGEPGFLQVCTAEVIIYTKHKKKKVYVGRRFHYQNATCKQKICKLMGIIISHQANIRNCLKSEWCRMVLAPAQCFCCSAVRYWMDTVLHLFLETQLLISVLLWNILRMEQTICYAWFSGLFCHEVIVLPLEIQGLVRADWKRNTSMV